MTASQVSFESLHAEPLTIAARLHRPDASGLRPAVIVLQGAEGPSQRGAAYAEALLRAGFVVLEPDLRSSAEASNVHERLPGVFAALRFLTAREEVDAGRIGLLGLGAGANAALIAATNFVHSRFAEGAGFAAFLALCPTCHLFNRAAGFELADLVWSPILVATAALDGYDNDPDAGPALARSLSPLDRAKVRTAVFYGAHHGFDLPGAAGGVEDPAANRGEGGRIVLAYDADAAARAHALAVQFFREMKAPPTPDVTGRRVPDRLGRS